jgi:putative transposase
MKTKTNKFHKSIRLSRECYSEPNRPFFITICAANKTQLFSNTKIALRMWELVVKGHLMSHSNLICACLMPDHLHTIQIPAKENLIDLIGRWKSYTTNVLRNEFKVRSLWQRSFYDRAVRKEEDLRKLAQYTINNPVRAGLVGSPKDYPYSWHIWKNP